MSFDYITPEEAIEADGLRMVVVGDIPSPWGEAAKGFFHVKGIKWKAVRLDYESKTLKKWVKRLDGPVAVLNDERPIHGWSNILFLAERLQPSPSLLPEEPSARALAFGLAHEFCGENGLGWARRLQGIHWGLAGKGGFPEPVAGYLAGKYSHDIDDGTENDKRVVALLNLFSDHLKKQKELGSDFYIGNALTAVDIYSATFMAMFKPLPQDQCAMHEWMRSALEMSDTNIDTALDPILIEHRDRMYRDFLELPLSL